MNQEIKRLTSKRLEYEQHTAVNAQLFPNLEESEPEILEKLYKAEYNFKETESKKTHAITIRKIYEL